MNEDLIENNFSDFSKDILIVDDYDNAKDGLHNSVLKEQGVFVINNELSFVDGLADYGIGVGIDMNDTYGRD